MVRHARYVLVGFSLLSLTYHRAKFCVAYSYRDPEEVEREAQEAAQAKAANGPETDAPAPTGDDWDVSGAGAGGVAPAAGASAPADALDWANDAGATTDWAAPEANKEWSEAPAAGTTHTDTAAASGWD